MTYPDGEVVTYHYNAAGQIESLTGNKLGKQSVIVKKIGYDKEGRTVMDNKYRYDAVDNILGISNVVNPQSLNKHNPAKLGGAFTHSYQYDDLNRLISATGKAKNASYQMQMTFGKMSEPLTKVQKVDSTETAKSYNLAYKYEDENHPTAPTEIGHEHYTYDANGNPILVENDSTNESREMYWDEENRLMVLKDNNGINRYTYNAAGERTMKVSGSMEGVYINGAPQGIAFHETDNFTLYPASILTVNKTRFTKHYFIGSQRIASKIGTGQFNNVYGRNGSHVTAGEKDYAARLNEIESQKEEYYKQLGVAPGVPTMKGAYGDPENTGVGYNAVLTELGNHDVPQGWIQTPRPNTTPNTNPGPPVSWNDPSNPDDPQAGYGYIPNDTTKEETFFYHSDHLGSTSYITDDHANITQYDAYLPYGELLVDEHSSREELPYKFNGKQFDEETGLYYYGARYMNPMASLFLSTDRFCEKNSMHSAYSFCMNNPFKYIDIRGDSLVLNSLKAVDETGYKALVSDLEKITGLSLQQDSKTRITYKRDSNGNAVFNSNGTSKTARDYLVEIIDNKDYLVVKSSPGNSETPNGGNFIKLSSKQIKEFIDNSHNLDQSTLGWGMVFFHESRHSKFGGSGVDDKNNWGTGIVVDFMNKIRQELGSSYGVRENYVGIPIEQEAYIPFDKSSLNSLKSGNKPDSNSKYIKYKINQ
ncbi:RHS repeat domain-containing protein [Prevotella denticola]|uniref:RHS repeat domain-containing protein n=1 Tax=Prevotella denticola TaxID=28129 RepID=UPI00356B7206